MSAHSTAAFNHSCLKIPRNPINKQPFPICEQRLLRQLENRLCRLDIGHNEMKTKQSPNEIKKTTKTLLEFYGSIPEYEDIHHLPAKEFYRRLEYLKEKQRDFYDFLDQEFKYESKENGWMEDYKNLGTTDKSFSSKSKLKSSMKSFCGTPVSNKSGHGHCKLEDVESIMSSEKEATLKPPSRRSVRIETPSEKISCENSPEPDYFRSKSRANLSSNESKNYNSSGESPWDDIPEDDFKFDMPLETRSAPNSPVKCKPNVGWKDTITIPKPFQMTVR